MRYKHQMTRVETQRQPGPVHTGLIIRAAEMVGHLAKQG